MHGIHRTSKNISHRHKNILKKKNFKKKIFCCAKSQKVFNSLSGEKAGFFFKRGVCLYRNYKNSSIIQTNCSPRGITKRVRLLCYENQQRKSNYATRECLVIFLK